MITLEDQPDLSDVANFYLHGSGVLGGTAGGDIVRMIALLDIGGGQVALRKMFVRRDLRGREHRVAHRLLNAVLDWRASRSTAETSWGRLRSSSWHRFCEKNGFGEIATNSLPASLPLMTVTPSSMRRVTNG